MNGDTLAKLNGDTMAKRLQVLSIYIGIESASVPSRGFVLLFSNAFMFQSEIVLPVLVPYIPLVILDPVFSEESAILILKCLATMVLFLTGYVFL